MPADRQATAVLIPPSVGEEKGAAAATVRVHEDGRLPSAAAAALATATGELGSKPAESSTNAPPPRPPPPPPPPAPKNQMRGEEGRAYSGRRRRGRGERQKPAVVVREIRLARGGSATAAAALLLGDGSVWWVPDLTVGSWQQVTTAAAGGLLVPAAKGFLPSDGVSAIAVVGARLPGQRSSPSETTTTTAGCGDETTVVVAGRDDGWLFLLTPPPSTEASSSSGGGANHAPDRATDHGEDYAGRDGASPTRPWRVGAAWRGHHSRVTAIWAVGDADHDSGGSRSPSTPLGGGGEGGGAGGKGGEGGRCQGCFTAALDTSRLRTSSSAGGGGRCCGIFSGELVSAGADGTVAWWEWEGEGGRADEAARSKVDEGEHAAGGSEPPIRPPKLRTVTRVRQPDK